MKETKKHNYRLIAIAISTFAAGIPIWSQDTRRLDFTDISFLILWVVIGIVVSFLAHFVVNLKIRDLAGSFAIGYVIAVVIHFVSGVLFSNYIYSGFEISLLLAILCGAGGGGIGSLLWSGLKKAGRKK